MKSVLANAKKPVGAVMMRPLLARLLADGRFVVFGAVREILGRSDAQAFRLPGLDGMRRVSRWRARFSAYDVYLSADFSILSPRSALKVHVFHGVSFRNHAIHASALRYDLLLLAGDYMRRRFESLGILDPGDERTAGRFRVVGVPKLDALFDGTIRRDAERERLGIAAGAPAILYAPTWSRTMSSLERSGEAIVDALLATDRDVIVKLHDNSFDLRKTRRDWRAYFRGLKEPRLRFVEAADVVPLMAAADVLVTDASSVANEFCLLDRPVLFMDIEGLAQKVKPKADLETWGRRAGTVVAEPKELADAIDEALLHPERLGDVRRALAKDLFHEPGRATDNAMRALYDALGMDPR